MSLILPLDLPWVLKQQPPKELTRLKESHWLYPYLLFAHSGAVGFVKGVPTRPLEMPNSIRVLSGATNAPQSLILNGSLGFGPNGSRAWVYDLGDAITAPVTLVGWMFGTAGASGNSIISLRRVTDQGGLSLNRSSGEAIQAIANSETGTAVGATSTGTFTSLAWTHGVAVFESPSSRTAYQNGADGVTDTTANPIPSALTRIAIAKSTTGAGGGYAASLISGIGPTMAISRVLTAEEVEILYQEQRRNPWSMFEERRLIVQVPLAAAVVQPDGIASAEAFGTAVVTTIHLVQPSGIASAEAFGTAVLVRTAVAVVQPSGIASGEAFGTAVVSRFTEATVTPTGIASAEAFGTAVVVRVDIVIPAGIASAEAFGTPVISATAGTTISPTGIASAEAFGTPVVTHIQLVIASGIASAEAFGTAVVTVAGAPVITPSGIVSAEVFGLATVTSDAPTGDQEEMPIILGVTLDGQLVILA